MSLTPRTLLLLVAVILFVLLAVGVQLGSVALLPLGLAAFAGAFLLGDGVELSLWEVEHTLTPDGRHMCEVYTSEDAARDAMERRAAQVS